MVVKRERQQKSILTSSWWITRRKEVKAFAEDSLDIEIFDAPKIAIHTLEGDMIVDSGDYIIKGVDGEFYPCKPDIFNKTYEKVADNSHMSITPWIPVSKELPEETVDVLIQLGTRKNGSAKCCVAYLWKDEASEWFVDTDEYTYYDIDEVDAWMPLPEPYKEKMEK